MDANDIIKSIGSIIKEEVLVNVDNKILPNTLVIESLHPFPGYHGSNLPENPLPNSIYLVTDKKYDGEDIFRAVKKIKKSIHYTFNASVGHTVILSETLHFIRIRNLDCFDCIPGLQEAFLNEGIRFMKKRTVNVEAPIKLQKFFRLNKIEDHIFKDLDEPLMYYFEIPEKPDWEFFKKTTLYIRNNVDNYSFDAALGILYQEELIDMVRIFAKELSADQLRFIRKKYLYELAHPDHLD